MQPGYYSSPIYGTFDARLDACWEDNCSDLVLSDISHWSTETYNNITSVTVNVTYTGTSYTSGTTTVTTDFISAALTGTITTDGTTAVVGVGTAFESELSVGDSILVDGTNEIITIESITDDTNLTLVSWATASAADTYYKANMETTLVPTDLGMTSTAFPDGEYTIVYTIVVNGTTYTSTRSGYNVCTVTCCINEKVATIPDLYNCSNCNHPEIHAIITYKGLLMSLEDAVRCGDFTRADNILSTLQDICNSTNCACS